MKKSYLLLLTILLISVTAKSQETQERYGTFILLSMPSNETEFKSIFKRAPSKSEMENITSLLNDYKGKPNVYVLNKPEDIDYLLTDLIKKWNDEELIKKYGGHYIPFPQVGFSIVGHNEGGDFYFPNGKSATLMDVEAKLKGYPAFFLSCNAKDFVDKSSIAVDFKLTYSEALNIAEDLENIAPSCTGLSRPRDIAEAMIKKLNYRNKANYTAKFIGAGGALSATFILLKQADKTDESIPKADSTSHN